MVNQVAQGHNQSGDVGVIPHEAAHGHAAHAAVHGFAGDGEEVIQLTGIIQAGGGVAPLNHHTEAAGNGGQGLGHGPRFHKQGSQSGPGRARKGGKTPADKDYITKIARFVKERTGGMDVVYGGGLKADNAAMLASIDEIDGGLIALTRFQGEIGFYPEEYLEIIRLYLGE